jgi:ankyrin repeat protein
MDSLKFDIFKKFKEDSKKDNKKEKIDEYLYYSIYDDEQYIKTMIQFDVQDSCGRVPLHRASMHDNLPLVIWLIKNGASVNYTNKYGHSAILWASFYGRYEIVQELIKSGADVNIKDIFGFTPLINAYYRGFKDVILLLESNGATITNDDIIKWSGKLQKQSR